jgi:tetratricopeptide (TPR) repeat protein
LSARKKPGRKRFNRPPKNVQHAAPEKRRRTEIKVRPHGTQGQWQLVHPRCAEERQEDLEEVQQMLDAGELDIAIDELRWLLEGCSDLVRAHQLLGEIALTEGDLPLARGHFGYAFDICRSALPPNGLPGPLPYQLPENQALHESAKGLALCLEQLGNRDLARNVLREMLRWDPSDPLAAAAMLAGLEGKPQGEESPPRTLRDAEEEEEEDEAGDCGSG